MTSIPSNLTRVPNLLVSRITLSGLASTNSELLRLQTQLSSSKRVNRPSDDPVAGSLINVLDQQMELSDQRSRNLSNAKSVLGVLDQRIGSISDMVLESKTIASSQVGSGSDASTREQQATVVNAMLNELYSTMNSDYAGMSLFAGSKVGAQAVETFDGGYRYMGDVSGLRTDLGSEIDFPLTLPADSVVGSLSSRMQGTVDLNATLTPDTMLRDLRGPMTGIDSVGTVSVTINGGTTLSVDLSGAETVGDAMDALESAIRTAAPGVLAGAFGTGVDIAPSGDRIRVNVAGANTVQFSDGPSGAGASALGLAGVTYDSGTATNAATSADLNPKVTDRTTMGTLAPTVALDVGSDLVISNGNRNGTVTVTAGMTVGELKEAVKRLDLGVRVEVNENGNSLDFVNEVAGPRMSVSEGGGTIAETLGVRTLMLGTPISVFNDGRGVEIADGNVDENGNPDASRNVDFEVTLSDGTTFTVDLVPSDIATMGTLVSKINSEAAAAGIPIGTGAGQFQASLSTTGNHLVLVDQLGGAAAPKVESLNGYAAEDLGLLDGTAVAGSPATLTSTDRSSVRVESLFTTMQDLRDSLANDDERGITFAGQRLETDLDRLNQARGLVGGRAQRVDQSDQRLEDKKVLDTSIKSNLQDLDYFEASSRLTLLQTQLQAAMTSAARTAPLSLLNFLA